jgi:adenylate cyclase
VEEGPELVERVWRSGARDALAANLTGLVLVTIYFELAAVPTKIGWWTDIVEIGAFAVAVVLSTRYMAQRTTKPILVWVAEQRSPTDAEQRATLRIPLYRARLTLAGWLVGAVVAAGSNYATHQSLALSARLFFGVSLSGVAVTFLIVLLSERSLRPVYALALGGVPAQRERVVGVRRRLLLFWALGSGLPLLGIALTPLGLPADDQWRIILAAVALAVIGLVTGLAFTFVAAASVAEPVANVRAAMSRVATGDLHVEVPVDDDGEMGLLQAGFNHMASGLREREQLRELFGGYVGEDVARQALEAGVSLEGEGREVSVLFVDLIGSTALSEQRSAVEVVRVLNQFFDAIIAAVDAEGGWVNKFEGDAALCVFGAPMAQGDHAARALRAATAMRDALVRLSGLDAGIGVSSGAVVAGNVGSEQRYEYTVVGDPVNEAARLTDLAKAHAGRIVVSERTVHSAGNGSGWKAGECVTLRGRSNPTQTFVPA